MIHLIIGQNRFRIDEMIASLTAKFDGETLRVSGEEIDLPKLTDLVAGTSLFSSQRLVIINGLSQNKSVWEQLPGFEKRISDDTRLVLIENSVDKRTKTYKSLAKVAKIVEANHWSQRERGLAEEWADQYAKERGMLLDRISKQHIVERSMIPSESNSGLVIDQQRLANALDTLSLLDKVDEEVIDTVLPPSIVDNVFDLLSLALEGNQAKLAREIESLARHEDPHRIFALLISQWTQLLSVCLASKTPSEVASDLGAHPFVISKLGQLKNRVSRRKLADVADKLAELDEMMKTSALSPWLAVERACIEISK